MKTPDQQRTSVEAENETTTFSSDNPLHVEIGTAIQKELGNFVVLYKFLSVDEFDATLDNWALKATLLYEAKDPLEMLPQAGPGGNILDFLNSEEYDPRPFFSFSRVISTPTMWGHYADSGKGVCMIFLLPMSDTVSKLWKHNTPHNKLPYVMGHNKAATCTGFKLTAPPKMQSDVSTKATNSSYLFPVRYVQDRVSGIVEFTKMQEESEDKANDQAWVNLLFSTKSEAWQYEEELRLACDLRFATKIQKSSCLYEWPLTYLAGVVAGPRCSYTVSILKQKLSIAYNQVRKRCPNYFCSNMAWLTHGHFLVSRAKYHWGRFEVEAAPWSDRQEGWGVMLDVLLNDVYQDFTPEQLELSIDSWNDFQKTINDNGQKKLLATSLENLPEHLRVLAFALQADPLFAYVRSAVNEGS